MFIVIARSAVHGHLVYTADGSLSYQKADAFAFHFPGPAEKVAANVRAYLGGEYAVTIERA